MQADSQGKQSGQDFDASLIDQKHFLGKDEQIAQQIADLEELEKKEGENSDEEMEGMASDDSDADEVRRVMNINYSDDDESMEEDDEEGEQEGSDVEMQEDSDDDDKAWFTMTEEANVYAQPPIAFKRLVAYFQNNPEFFKFPDLFDAAFTKDEFQEVDLYLS